MKKIILFISSLLFANDILTPQKSSILHYNYLSLKEDATSLKKSVLNPIMLNYSITKDNSVGIKRDVSKFSVSINQPIFKSGAIYYSLKYADILKDIDKQNSMLRKKELLKNAYDLVFDYKIALIDKENIKLNIKNSEIEVKKRENDFLNGVGNSIDLNNAILKLNNLKISLQDIDLKIESIKNSFKALSNRDIDTIKLPLLKPISKKEYLNNLNLQISKRSIELNKYSYYMQRGNQLLSINFIASLNHQKIDYSKNLPQFKDDTINYYNIGISFSIPLSFNGNIKVLKSKYRYIKSLYEYEDNKKQYILKYKNYLKEIRLIDKKIHIYKSSLKAYNNLISSIKESLKAGNLTLLDLMTIQNSKKTILLNIKKLNLQKEKILFDLNYKI